MEMDWNKETSGSYEVYPAGSYQLRCTDWERCESAKKGTPQIRFKFEILSPEQYKGKPFTDHIALIAASEKSKGTLWRLANLILALGIDTSEAPNMDTDSNIFDEILTACKERTTYVTIIETTYDGKQKNEVDQYNQDTNQALIIPEIQTSKSEW